MIWQSANVPLRQNLNAWCLEPENVLNAPSVCNSRYSGTWWSLCVAALEAGVLFLSLCAYTAARAFPSSHVYKTHIQRNSRRDEHTEIMELKTGWFYPTWTSTAHLPARSTGVRSQLSFRHGDTGRGRQRTNKPSIYPSMHTVRGPADHTPFLSLCTSHLVRPLGHACWHPLPQTRPLFFSILSRKKLYV